MLTRRILFFLLAVFAVSCGKGGTETPGAGGDDEAEKVELSVMSFNVLVTHADDAGDELWSVREPACVGMIRTLAPDVIGIQECRQAQYETLVSDLPEYGSVNIPEKKTNFGTCIFYRKSVFDCYGSGYLWFSDSPSVPSPAFSDICDDPTYRTYIWADLRLAGTDRTVRLYSTHFPRNYGQDNSDARRKCAQAMVDHAKRACGDDATVFMTGDMNCSFANGTGRMSLTPFTSWMKSARESLPDSQRDQYYSLNSFNDEAPLQGGQKSIDHIFLRNAEAVGYRTVVEEYAGVRFMSDHYPILVKCIIK